MDGQADGWTDGRTDSPCVLQDFVPFGAAALLPLNLNHTLLKQGTGTADHLPPLGCYFLLFWAAAPKGMKSCRTQGPIHLSVRSLVPPRPSQA